MGSMFLCCCRGIECLGLKLIMDDASASLWPSGRSAARPGACAPGFQNAILAQPPCRTVDDRDMTTQISISVVWEALMCNVQAENLAKLNVRTRGLFSRIRETRRVLPISMWLKHGILRC